MRCWRQTVIKLTFCLAASAFIAGSAAAQLRVDQVGLKGSIATGAVTCGATETAVPTTALTGRRAIAIVNISGSDIFVGPTGVTTSNGFEIATDTSLTIDATDGIAFYCISAAGGKEIRYLEIR